MPAIVQSILEGWRRASLIQRVILLGIVLGCVGAAVLLTTWAGRPQMALLYSGMDPKDAADIVEQLKDEGVPYELAEGGTTVRVPTEQVYSMRLKMASAGLPAGGTGGYQILDNQEIGSSPFLQRKNFNRALEGELARTIQLIEGVDSARVHVVRPESNLFGSNDSKSTASVVLRLRPGRRVTQGNVGAIVNLLAGSVEGLQPSEVSVIDNQGRLLSGSERDELTAKAGSLHEHQARIEQDAARKAEDMLARALGPGRAIVRVSARIDSTSVTTVKTDFDPQARVVSRENIKSRMETPGSDEQGGGQSSEEEVETEYEVSKTIEQRTDLPGKVTNLSVAAFVDLTPDAEPSGEEGQGAAADAGPLLTVDQVKSIIAKAVGLEELSSIEVVATDFQPDLMASATGTGAVESPEGPFGLGPYLEILKQSSLGILVVGFLIALRMLRGSRKSAGIEASLQSTEQLEGGRSAALEGPEGRRRLIASALQENPEQVRSLFAEWAGNDR